MSDKERAPYFTSEEQRLIMVQYEEEKCNIATKGNTVAAANRRQQAWQRIADYVNACNPSGVKRTWEQIKNKYKNIIASANRKKNLRKQTGFGGPVQGYTAAEELAISSNKGRPLMDGVSWGVATSPGTKKNFKYLQTDGSTLVVVVPEGATSETVSQPEVMVDLEGDGETVSVSSEAAVEEETALPPPAEPRASTSTGDRPTPSGNYQRKRPHKRTTAALDELYKKSLQKDRVQKLKN